MVSKSEVIEESNLAEVSMNEKAYKTRQNTVRSKKDNDSSWMALTEYGPECINSIMNSRFSHCSQLY